MNVNEVVSNRGNEIAEEKILHPNDHVNKSQSSNDTFPTAMHISAIVTIKNKLFPACDGMVKTLSCLEEQNKDVIKTGRTHLQDATPLTFGQEISGWKSMIIHDKKMIERTFENLSELALGGTAVGTGLNAHKDFGKLVAHEISEITGEEFVTAENKFHSLTSKDAIVFTHGALKALAADMMKIANDVRWLASGPRCGIGEIKIPENEPGSSIMPGKVNPTQCEAVTMVSVKVMGNDTSIGIAASQGNFQLNVFMPLIINDFLESVNLLSEAINSFDKNCLMGIKPNMKKINENNEKSLMIVTALNPFIGYEKSAIVAKKAFNENISLKEAGEKLEYFNSENYDIWVNLENMIKPLG
jgi:fumarate hydratase class II